jgi:tRNA (guanine10-N2)-dimethyltransferase
MKYFFYLDGANFDLSFYELKALFDIYDVNHRVTKKDVANRLVVVNCDTNEEVIKKLCERSALIRYAGLFVKKVNGLELDDFEKVDWGFVQIPYAVRVEDSKGLYSNPGLEANLGSVVWWDLEERGKIPRVNLVKPKTLIYFFVADEDEIYISKYIWKPVKGRFKKREPQNRPGFHPASLKPKLARLMVNLSRCGEGKKLLDCFCGVGGVLIEGGVIGCKPHGIDIDPKLLSMCRKNLRHYKVKAEVAKGDARLIRKSYKGKFDAVATDPPYGRSSSLGKVKMDELYDGFLTSCWKSLKNGSYLAMIYPHYGFMKQLINSGQYKIDFETGLYVHGGLTRKILVLRKV